MWKLGNKPKQKEAPAGRGVEADRAGFFDDYPRFFDTSDTFAYRGRLNLRHQAMIAANSDVLAGARVLDIASHDGRWSFAALQAGAAHVTGIEARKDLVKRAEDSFAHYEADPTKYQFICGDVFDTLTTEELDVDVVMCLGFLYHTLRYNELFTRIRELSPRNLIIDTNVIPKQTAPVIRLLRDDTSKQQHAAADDYSHNGVALVGKPSTPAVQHMLETYDFEVEDIYDWQSLIAERPGVTGVADYNKEQRVTLRSKLRA